MAKKPPLWYNLAMDPINRERHRLQAARHRAEEIVAAALADGVDAVLAAVTECHRLADRLWAECRAAAPDEPAACAAGCGWCCHQPVEVSTAEALAIAAALRLDPDAARWLAGWTGGRLCPFLVEGACAIYPIRPLKCRGLYQPDPRWCMATFAKIDPPEGGPPIRHRALILPRQLYDAVGQGMTGPLYRAGLECSALDFAPALRAVIDRPDAAAAWARGESPFPEHVRLHGWVAAAG